MKDLLCGELWGKREAVVFRVSYFNVSFSSGLPVGRTSFQGSF